MTEKKRTPIDAVRTAFMNKEVQRFWRILALQGTRFMIGAIVIYLTHEAVKKVKEKKK